MNMPKLPASLALDRQGPADAGGVEHLAVADQALDMGLG
jgi:hypothetical protein